MSLLRMVVMGQHLVGMLSVPSSDFRILSIISIVLGNGSITTALFHILLPLRRLKGIRDRYTLLIVQKVRFCSI